MEGYRTIIVALVGGPLAAWFSKHGLAMTPEVQAWFVGGVMSLLMVAMRLITKTPVGGAATSATIATPPKQGGYIRPLMLGFLLAISVPAAMILPACSAFAPAQSIDQRLAYAYATHTAVLNAAASSVRAGDLSSTQGDEILKLADESRRILDGAKVAVGAGDIKTAQGQLALATGILTELQTQLRSHK